MTKVVAMNVAPHLGNMLMLARNVVKDSKNGKTKDDIKHKLKILRRDHLVVRSSRPRFGVFHFV